MQGFSSGVLTNGGAIQREQEREAKKERERLEKEAYEKHAADVAAKRIKAREERALELIAQAQAKKAAYEEGQRIARDKSIRDEEERLKSIAIKEAARLVRQQELEIQKAAKEAQKAERKSQAVSLLDDLSKEKINPSSNSNSNLSPSLSKLAEDLEEGEEVEVELDVEGVEDLEAQTTFNPVKGEVYIPASMATIEGKLEPQSEPQAYDLGALLPTPSVITVEALAQSSAPAETAEELLSRVLNPQSTDSNPELDEGIDAEASSDIKSKRGRERMQKIINEKRDLEKQVVDLQTMVTTLQDAVRKYEIEGNFVGNVMTLADAKKKPSELVTEAKLQMLKFLNTRSDEIDHIDKANCFNKYMSDPFYMQVFVQSNQPEQWQTMIESIYESIERPEPSLANNKPIANQSFQPIRARTSTLGAPLASVGNPMDRIAQHLGNMGI